MPPLDRRSYLEMYRVRHVISKRPPPRVLRSVAEYRELQTLAAASQDLPPLSPPVRYATKRASMQLNEELSCLIKKL